MAEEVCRGDPLQVSGRVVEAAGGAFFFSKLEWGGGGGNPCFWGGNEITQNIRLELRSINL